MADGSLTLPWVLRPEADDVLGRRPRRWRYACRFLLSSTSTGFTLWSAGSIASAAGLSEGRNTPGTKRMQSVKDPVYQDFCVS